MLIGLLVVDIELTETDESAGHGFADERALEMFDAKTVVQAVRAFYGHGDNDAEMSADAAAMQAAAGWTGDGSVPR